MDSGDVLGLGWTTRSQTSIAVADRHRALILTGSGTVALPALADIDFAWSVIVLSTNAAGLTLDGDGSETINGATTLALAQYDAVMLFQDKTNWYAAHIGAGSGGAVGLEYDSTTSKADPGSGKFRGNNATWSSITEFYLDDEDASGMDLGGLYDGLAGGANLYIKGIDDDDTHLFTVTGDPVDESGYWTIAVSYRSSGGGTIANGDDTFWTFVPGNMPTIGSTEPTDKYAGKIWLDTTTSGPASVLSVVTKTANYTATAQDDVILVDASSGAVTITLPAIGTVPGKVYHIKKIDSSGNAVTVDGDSAETIDGATTQIISVQYDSLFVVDGATEWGIH